MKRLAFVVAVLLICASGCASQPGGFDGLVVGGCTLHQANSALAGVAWADCPSNTHVYVSGTNEGYVEAAAPIASGILQAGILGYLIPAPTTNVTVPPVVR